MLRLNYIKVLWFLLLFTAEVTYKQSKVILQIEKQESGYNWPTPHMPLLEGILTWSLWPLWLGNSPDQSSELWIISLGAMRVHEQPPQPSESTCGIGYPRSLSITDSCILFSYWIIVFTRLDQGHRTTEKYRCGFHLYISLTVHTSIIKSDQDSFRGYSCFTSSDREVCQG